MVLMIGIIATPIVGIIVYLFPGQKHPKENSRVAMMGFGFTYFCSVLLQSLISGA